MDSIFKTVYPQVLYLLEYIWPARGDSWDDRKETGDIFKGRSAAIHDVIFMQVLKHFVLYLRNLFHFKKMH